MFLMFRFTKIRFTRIFCHFYSPLRLCPVRPIIRLRRFESLKVPVFWNPIRFLALCSVFFLLSYSSKLDQVWQTNRSSKKYIRLSGTYLYGRKNSFYSLFPFLVRLLRPFLLRKIWDKLTSSKLFYNLWYISISVANVGHSIRLVVMSTKSESGSNCLKVLI